MNKLEQKIKELEEDIVKLKTSVEQLKILNEIAVSAGKATDIDQMLKTIVHKSVKALEAEQGSILLVTENKDRPFKTFMRQEDSSSLKHAYHIGSNITGWVLKYKKPLIIENLSEDKRFNPSQSEKKDIKSVLCVPIWFEGNIIGLMMLINKKNKNHFSKDDLTMFSIISVQAGQLIKNLEWQRNYFQEKKETEELQELDRLKTNFFTNISHEFRTPLTLILGPAKQILEENNVNKIKEHAEIIFKNGSKLKNLANQILDLARIDAGHVKLKVQKRNLNESINEIVSSFYSLAEVKKISFKFIKPENGIVIYLDQDKIEKIITNLLSNAFKFTPEGGKITVKVWNKPNLAVNSISTERNIEMIQIDIEDTGIGIPESKINNIFNRFYQVEEHITEKFEGTGIGLSLTKELIELHKGKISVESRKGMGTKFSIFLSKDKSNYLPEEITEEENIIENKRQTEFNKSNLQKEPVLGSFPNGKEEKLDKDFNINDYENYIGKKNEKPFLLIIEDNTDVRKYIKSILNKNYKIIEARDGAEGLTKAFDKIPNLIISDTMMPKFDGIQLCKELKADNRTSHIPLILLTAKSSTSDKIEGYETGADDYIMKPFEASELKARINNLLLQRKRIHEHFKKHGFLTDDNNLTSIDQKFLQNVIWVINKYIQENSFTVEKLSDELAVSRSLLHKKLISLVGESPSDLIRRLRLNKAAKLIEQKAYNISEVALEVGFNNPSYFAKCFQKQFGFSPSNYHKNLPKI